MTGPELLQAFEHKVVRQMEFSFEAVELPIREMI
jgi:hypothetical protein